MISFGIDGEEKNGVVLKKQTKIKSVKENESSSSSFSQLSTDISIEDTTDIIEGTFELTTEASSSTTPISTSSTVSATTPSLLVDRSVTPKHSHPNSKILHAERRQKDKERKDKIQKLSKKIKAYDYDRSSFMESSTISISRSDVERWASKSKSLTSISSIGTRMSRSSNKRGLRGQDRVIYLDAEFEKTVR